LKRETTLKKRASRKPLTILKKLSKSMTRFQIELSDAQNSALEQLMEDCGIATKKELMNNAFTLLEWAVNERKHGRAIASLDDENGKLRELILPIFMHVRISSEEAVPVHA
jgi:hypothetical protein